MGFLEQEVVYSFFPSDYSNNIKSAAGSGVSGTDDGSPRGAIEAGGGLVDAKTKTKKISKPPNPQPLPGNLETPQIYPFLGKMRAPSSGVFWKEFPNRSFANRGHNTLQKKYPDVR